MRISDWSSDVCSSDLNRRLYRRALERFGDEERRLWPFAGQQPFGESGDEEDWHRKFWQYVLDRIDLAAVIGKLNVSQHQARPPRHGLAHGFSDREGEVERQRGWVRVGRDGDCLRKTNH